MNLKDFQCKGCLYFRKGKCLCFLRKEGPRGNKDCRTCRCVIISYILAKKKHTQKLFYHLRRSQNRRKCGCNVVCKLRTDGLPCQRKGPKGKRAFVVHKTCAASYKKCYQMVQLEKNLDEFTKLVEAHGRLEIPSKCIPFLGTKQRNFKEFADSHAQCMEKRDVIATKTKLKLAWTSTNMANLPQYDFLANVSSSDSDSSDKNSDFSENVHLFADIPETLEITTQDLVENGENLENTIQINTLGLTSSVGVGSPPSSSNLPYRVSSPPSPPAPCRSLSVALSSPTPSPTPSPITLSFSPASVSSLSSSLAPSAGCSSAAAPIHPSALSCVRNTKTHRYFEEFHKILAFHSNAIHNTGRETSAKDTLRTHAISEFLLGDPCPYSGLDEYFSLLREYFPETSFFPSLFLNEIVICCKQTTKRIKLQGFGYTKALEDPWQYTIQQCMDDPTYLTFSEAKHGSTARYLFPIRTKLNDNNIHWYLIVFEKSQNTFEIWDNLWATQTQREKKWDCVLVRRLHKFLCQHAGTLCKYSIVWQREIRSTDIVQTSVFDSIIYICQFAKHLVTKMPLLRSNMLCFVRPLIVTEITAQKLLVQEFENEGEVSAVSDTSPLSTAPSTSAKVAAKVADTETTKAINPIRLSKTSGEKRKKTAIATISTKPIRLSKTSGGKSKKTAIATISTKPIRLSKTSGGKRKRNAVNKSEGGKCDEATRRDGLHSSSMLPTSHASSEISLPLTMSEGEMNSNLLPAPIMDFGHDHDDILKFCS